jgi:CBS domain containing-hemolysin-like protein
MNYLLLSLLFIAATLFYMLEVAFQSFSRVALAGFIDDIESERVKNFGFVEKYEIVFHNLRGFSFLLQFTLLIYSYLCLALTIPDPLYRVILLAAGYLVYFNFLLYTFSFLKNEAVLARLIHLVPLAWVLLYPLNMVFSFFAGKKTDEKDNPADDPSKTELEVFIEEGAKEGVLESEDKEMIHSILEFGDTLVKEIITPRVDMHYIEMETGLEELVEKINHAKKSRYPVISGRIDNIDGIILAKDVFDYWTDPEQREKFSIKKILRKAFFVPETMRILELLKELQKSKQKFAIVVDEFGGISGVVTMEDIIEEIVGEIHDEYDEDTEPIVKVKDHFIVKGDTDIYDLGDTLGVPIDEDEDYQTVAGLMSFVLGKIPAIGDTVELDGYVLEVTEIEKNRVKKVRILQKKKKDENGVILPRM